MALSQAQIDQLVASGQLSPATAKSLAANQGAVPGTPVQGTLPSPMLAPDVAPPDAQANMDRVAAMEGHMDARQGWNRAVAANGTPGAEIASQTPNLVGTRPAVGARNEDPVPYVAPKDVNPLDLAKPGAPKPAAPAGPVAGAGGGGAPAKPKPNEMLLANQRYQRATNENLGEQEQNVQRHEDIDSRLADRTAETIRRQNDAIQGTEEFARGEHVKRQANALRAVDDLNAKSAELANYKEDPKRLFSNMNTGQKILGVVGLLLNGRVGLEKLTEQQDRDIQAQRATYEAKKSSVAAQNSAFGKLMDVYHDADSADAALRVMQIDHASRELQRVAAESGSEQAKAKAADALTALKQKRDDLTYQFSQQQYAITHPVVKGGGGAAGGWSKGTIYPNEQEFAAGYKRALAENPKLTVEDFKRSVMGNGGKGGGSSRLAASEIRAANAGDAMSSLGHSYGLEKDPKTGQWVAPGFFAAKGSQIANVAGDAAGTGASAMRDASKGGAVAETAAALSGGAPNEMMLREVGEAFHTNDPAKIANALNHYGPLLERARTRYGERAGLSSDLGEEGAER